MAPRAVFGVPLYNGATLLPAAIESLLGQTEPHLAVVLVDDASSDATEPTARRYAELDPRVTYHRNERRLGLVGNWRRAFDLAVEQFPDTPYFAWASDHDVWHPRWLEVALSTLDGSPSVALAFARTEIIDAEGSPKSRRMRPVYDSRAVADPVERLREACTAVVAGNAVYGLARVSLLRRAGPYRQVLQPDRLLVRTLALHGHLVETREVLWYRRVVGRYSRARQRASFFMARTPLHAYLPAPMVHAAIISWLLGVRGRGLPGVSRARGLAAAAAYLRATLPDSLRGPARLRRRAGRLPAQALRRSRRRVRRSRARALRVLRQSRRRVLRHSRRRPA